MHSFRPKISVGYIQTIFKTGNFRSGNIFIDGREYKKILVKIPKCKLIDTSIRNALLENFGFSKVRLIFG